MATRDESDWVFRDRHPERVQVYAHYERLSELERGRTDCSLNVLYGPHPRERMDLFPASSPGAPLIIFIHGGYWQSQSKERFSFVANPLNAAGFSVALLGYPLAPERSLPEIINSVDHGVDAAISAFGPPPIAWVAAGHSAGGHLALCAAKALRTVPLAGVAALSPILDLAPLQDTTLDTALRLTPEIISDFSPLFQPPSAAPVRIWIGGDETPGFLNQAQAYSRRMEEADVRVTLLDGLNHYTIPGEIIAAPSCIIAGLRELCRHGGSGS